MFAVIILAWIVILILALIVFGGLFVTILGGLYVVARMLLLIPWGIYMWIKHAKDRKEAIAQRRIRENG